MTQESQKANTVLIVIAIIGIVGTIVASTIGVIGNYNIEKLRQEFELTKIAWASMATQGGATQTSMASTMSAPTSTLYPTESPLPKDTDIPTPIPTFTPIPTQTPDLRLFWDDFEMGLSPKWELISGNCSMSNGVMICPNGVGRIEAGDYGWTNYKISFDTAGYWTPGWGALLVRISSDGAYLKMNLNICNNASWVYHGADGREQDISMVQGSVCENTKTHIEIEMDGKLIRTKMNGNGVGIFENNIQKSGRFGFMLNGPWVDNVAITRINP